MMDQRLIDYSPEYKEALYWQGYIPVYEEDGKRFIRMSNVPKNDQNDSYLKDKIKAVLPVHGEVVDEYRLIAVNTVKTIANTFAG